MNNGARQPVMKNVSIPTYYTASDFAVLIPELLAPGTLGHSTVGKGVFTGRKVC